MDALFFCRCFNFWHICITRGIFPSASTPVREQNNNGNGDSAEFKCDNVDDGDDDEMTMMMMMLLLLLLMMVVVVVVAMMMMMMMMMMLLLTMMMTKKSSLTFIIYVENISWITNSVLKPSRWLSKPFPEHRCTEIYKTNIAVPFNELMSV